MCSSALLVAGLESPMLHLRLWFVVAVRADAINNKSKYQSDAAALSPPQPEITWADKSARPKLAFHSATASLNVILVSSASSTTPSPMATTSCAEAETAWAPRPKQPLAPTPNQPSA